MRYGKLIIIFFYASLLILGTGCSTLSVIADDREPNKTMLEKYGVEIISLRLTSANYMLNFKYKVLDPEKAAPLHDRKINPYLILERNNSRFSVPVTPKLGSIRSSPKFAQAGKNYFVFFGNPGGYVKTGDLVTIVIGNFRVEHIKVE